MLRRLPGGVAVLVAATLSGVSAAATHGTPTLGSTVVASGRASYSVAVVLPKRATADIRQFSIVSGAGRFYGFVLRKDGPGVTPFAFSVRAGLCLSRGCIPATYAPGGVDCVCGIGTTGISAELPAGRYHLYLIADGRPVTVRLHLGGLKGVSTFRRGASISPIVDQPPPATAIPATTYNYYSAGVTRSVGSQGGFIYDVIWKLLIDPAKSVNSTGICNTIEPAGDNPTGAFQYPCNTQEPGSIWIGGQLTTSRTVGPLDLIPEGLTTLASAGYIDSRRQSLGAFDDSAFPATEAHTQILWLPFG